MLETKAAYQSFATFEKEFFKDLLEQLVTTDPVVDSEVEWLRHLSRLQKVEAGVYRGHRFIDEHTGVVVCDVICPADHEVDIDQEMAATYRYLSVKSLGKWNGMLRYEPITEQMARERVGRAETKLASIILSRSDEAMVWYYNKRPMINVPKTDRF